MMMNDRVFDREKANIEHSAWNETNRYRGELAIFGEPKGPDALQDQQYLQSINFYGWYPWRYFLTLNFIRFADYEYPVSVSLPHSKTLFRRTQNTLYGPNEVRVIHTGRENSLPKKSRRKRAVTSIDEDIEFVIKRFLEFFLGKYWTKKQDEWPTILVVREGRGDDQHFHLLITDHEAINGLDHMADALMRVTH